MNYMTQTIMRKNTAIHSFYSNKQDRKENKLLMQVYRMRIKWHSESRWSEKLLRF